MTSLKWFNLLFVLLLSAGIAVAQQTGADTVKQPADTVKQPVKKKPNYYTNVDVIIIYQWVPDEPEVCQNVNAEVVKEKGKITEVIVYRRRGKDRIKVEKGLIHFKIRDRKTGKIIVKGP